VACPPAAFQLGFGEELDAESASAATATLTPEGGSPQALALSLTPDARAAYLTGAALQAGIRYTLHLEGLRDRAGNLLWQWGAHTGAPLLTFTLTDPTVFQVLEDTAPPRLLAALDAADGLYLALEEPVEVASGFTLDTSIAVLRQGQLVQGTVSQLSPQLFRWKPVEAGQWLAGGQYTLSAVHLQDLAAHAALAPSLSFTHMAASSQVAYLVYQAPGDSQPQPRSSYGLTTLFQGRSWHEELGLYHYRARWYSPELGDFLERDPLGYFDSPNLYQFVNRNPVNFLDPLGEWFIINEIWPCTKDRNLRVCAQLRLYDNSGVQHGPILDGLAQGSERTLALPKLVCDGKRGCHVVDEEKLQLKELGLKTPPAGSAERRGLRNGDTPFGVFLSGELASPNLSEVGKRSLREVVEEMNKSRGRVPESFGWVVINMDPIHLEEVATLLVGKKKVFTRDLLLIHGGNKNAPDPLAPCQQLGPTQGCLRFANADLLVLAEEIKRLRQQEMDPGVIIVGDAEYLHRLIEDSELEDVWKSKKVEAKTGLSLATLRQVLAQYPKVGR
jgi:RHS repeat-associated protein